MPGTGMFVSKRSLFVTLAGYTILAVECTGEDPQKANFV
jgi:hypothetical protein